MVVALWITEISSPFLHLRELLKELGYKDTDLSLVADVSSNSWGLLPTFFIVCAKGRTWFCNISIHLDYSLCLHKEIFNGSE